ncbi:hypothetical protein BDP27DRAFT_1428881 [Rhodocollybia butyracea]|uniref:Uncharacterized protein n=1 Tax=Rhodocollybia butyracea TaxID=206335 RepID=A0A9P5TZG9_9AGAR|nr:hypothetical protein BDP27DRAFT_1428881 [Rhodocollybia butyracea]
MLSNSDNIHIDEGSVDKNNAFNAVVALFMDPDLMYPKWIEETLETWQLSMDWMLPKAKKAPLVDGEDAASSLTQISSVVQALIARDKAAANVQAKPKDVVAPPDHMEVIAIETAKPVEETAESMDSKEPQLLTPPSTSPGPEYIEESELSDLDNDSKSQPKALSSKEMIEKHVSTLPSPNPKPASPALKPKIKLKMASFSRLPKPISVATETPKPSKNSTAKPPSKKTSAKPSKKNLTTTKTKTAK